MERDEILKIMKKSNNVKKFDVITDDVGTWYRFVVPCLAFTSPEIISGGQEIELGLYRNWVKVITYLGKAKEITTLTRFDFDGITIKGDKLIMENTSTKLTIKIKEEEEKK
ncbi:MAG: hypothetical protein WC248_04540 [Candidatus Methanomethylophilaceae archaeon]|jgi:hypothetical protein